MTLHGYDAMMLADSIRSSLCTSVMYRGLMFILPAATIAWCVAVPSFEPGIALVAALAAYVRDEVHGLVGFRFVSLAPRVALIRNLTHLRYSFTRPDYIHPAILADLNGSLSDRGDEVVSINVLTANDSNRYFGDVVVDEGTNPPIVTSVRGQDIFRYQYLGRSVTGMHLVRTWHSSGGSGVFCDVLMVTVGTGPAIEVKDNKVTKGERLTIKKIAAIPLGDRFEGSLRYRFGVLSLETSECAHRRRRFLIL